MDYILVAESEEERLDKQSLMDEFSLEKELAEINFPKGASILDAGCGSGVFCRYLEEHFPDTKISGCDLSLQSLEYAKRNSLNKETYYFEHDLSKPFNTKYDYIFNRLVGHHLNPLTLEAVIQNFYQTLNPGGKLIVVDLDGMFLNLGTLSLDIREGMEKVRSSFSGDLFNARRIPQLMRNAGFENVSWRIDTIDFKGEGRKREIEQWRERFLNSIQFYEKIFGSNQSAWLFLNKYIDEASDENTTMFYNKFIIQSRKR